MLIGFLWSLFFVLFCLAWVLLFSDHPHSFTRFFVVLALSLLLFGALVGMR